MVYYIAVSYDTRYYSGVIASDVFHSNFFQETDWSLNLTNLSYKGSCLP